jgi:PAS domain S-box-containing protein
MEKIAASRENRKIPLRYALGVVLAWTFIFFCLGLFNYFDSLNMVKLNAISQGRDAFNKDLALQRWVASHGGVYVFPDQKTPPTPYLSYLLRRDLVTRDGQTLTLVNPAYVVRQVYELSFEEFGLRGHITSLKPLNPKNTPDTWETRALKDLARGVPEVVAETAIDGQPFLRLMRPLFVEKICLKCHGIQGYKVGELLGGTSVSIPMRQVLAYHQGHMLKILGVYLILWSAGLLVIYIIFRDSRKRLLKSAEQRLYIRRLSSLLEQTHSAVMIVGLDGTIEFVNPGYEQLVGYSAAEMLGCNVHKLFLVNEMQEQLADLWQTVNQGRRWRGIIASRSKNGKIIYEDATGFPLFDEDGKIINFALVKHNFTVAHKLQNQLIQSQKMEAVGTLASGVAHDFNNILTVINSFSEILIDEIEPDSPIRSDLVEILEAGLRAADLTRQLLAFSRR